VISPDRDQGREWAREELARPEYANARPGLFDRVVGWIRDHLDRVSSSVGLSAGQLLALLLILVVAAAVLVMLVRRNVRTRVVSERRSHAVLADRPLSGAEHRRLAEEATIAGRYDDAVREWMRSLARRLDERGLIDPRPGRTADELAVEAGRLLPGLAADLSAGARIFDDVSYGLRPAGAAQAELLRHLADAAEVAGPARAGVPVILR
jgi:cell division protein FtsL